MSENAPVQISLEGYLLFLTALAVLIAAVIWFVSMTEKRARHRFLAQFDASDLRMSPHQIGLVYQVTATTDDAVSVIPIWRGKSAISNGAVQRLAPDQVIPFDPERFF